MITSTEHGVKVLNPQSVSEFNPTTGVQVLNKVSVDKDNVDVDKAPVVVYKPTKVKDKAPVKKPTAVMEKPTAVVVKDLTVVVNEKASVKDNDKAPVKKPAAVVEKSAAVVVKDPAVVVNEMASVQVLNKALTVMANDSAELDKYKDKEKEKAPDVVNYKASAALKINAADVKEKSVGNGKKSTVGKDKASSDIPKDKPKNNTPDVVKEGSKPNRKQKFILIVQALSQVLVLRSLKQKFKPEVKSKADVRVLRSKETPVKRKRILSKEDDRKKKGKGKSKEEDFDSELETDEVDSSSDEVDRKRKKLKIKAALKRKRNCSDSLSIDEENIKRLLNKMKKKVKKEESDEEIVPKKELRVDMLNFLSEIGFSSLHNVTIDKIPSKLGRFVVANFNEKTYKLSSDSGDKIELVVAQEIDFLFKVNFLTLFTNMMGMSDGLKGQICLDVVRRLREDCVISDIDWCGYIYDCLQYSKLPLGTNHYLGPLTFLVELELKDNVLGLLELHGEWTEAEDLLKKSEEKLSLIYAEKVMLEEYLRKASLEYLCDGKFLDLQEKYVQLFKDPISFNDDGNGDNDGDDDANDGDGNGDDEDGNLDDDGEGHKDPSGSNPSFGFSKISLDDFGNGSGKSPNNQVVEKESVDPTVKGTVVEGKPAEEYEIMSTPENYTQWLERNAYLVGEIIDSITDEYLYGDLFCENLGRMEVLNQGPLTPERMPTHASNVSPNPKKRVVKPSSYMLSPYMNKKTKVVPKITRLEFILGNSLFAMQGNKMESFSNQVKAQFKGNEGDLALEGYTCLTKTTAMTILDNRAPTYDSKYKQVGDLLKRLFARHLKLYGHNRHSKVGKLKQTIPTLKWRTKGNFQYYGVFTMLYMEAFKGNDNEDKRKQKRAKTRQRNEEDKTRVKNEASNQSRISLIQQGKKAKKKVKDQC
ncbi:hypothetical protein Tco_1017439 [Tanacetum coccineum]|uniref:Ulp1 protease family, C-terminal catalytic domain-containing protein n=1 Tax=Tanacetum coccineum TaxID=301880 RepID=A0ABQ5FSJ9_9ASTR